MVGDPMAATLPPGTLTADGTKISFGPVLIHGGATLRLTLITEGAPHLTCKNPPLINVKVKEQIPDLQLGRPALQVFMPSMAAVFLCVGAFTIFGPGMNWGPRIDWTSALVLFGLFLITEGIAFDLSFKPTGVPWRWKAR